MTFTTYIIQVYDDFIDINSSIKRLIINVNALAPPDLTHTQFDYHGTVFDTVYPKQSVTLSIACNFL